MYDAIVVGARVAGAPTAMLLARRGLRVLLVDRASFPSDTVSTHYIPQAGVAYVRDWGLLTLLEASNAPRILDYTSDWGDFTLVGRPPPVDGQVGGYAPRRTVLDKLLADAAVEAGAELRERFPVTRLLREGERVVGVESHGRAERAPIVVGADGRHSFVARAVGADVYGMVPARAFQYYSYFSGVSRGVLETYRRGRRGFFVFPTNDDLACVITAAPIGEFAEFRRDPAGNFRRRLAPVPDLAERVAAGRQEDRLFGTADLDNFFRVPSGPGWALVGDAGYHKDPQTGQGIRDAFRDAAGLADAIVDGLGGARPLEEALADYHRARDAAVDEIFEHTCKVAEMAEPTEFDFELRAALRESPEDTALAFGIGDGTVSPRWFFSEENVARILGRARDVIPRSAATRNLDHGA